MQQEGHTSTLQGFKHHQNIIYGTQRQGNQTSENWVIYKYKCPQINCPEEYIGETGRVFWDRLKEHLRAPSTNIPAPQEIQSALTVLTIHRESQGTTRNIREAMFIRANDPSLNRNLGK